MNIINNPHKITPKIVCYYYYKPYFMAEPITKWQTFRSSYARQNPGASVQQASEEWSKYKEIHGVITGTTKKSPSKKRSPSKKSPKKSPTKTKVECNSLPDAQEIRSYIQELLIQPNFRVSTLVLPTASEKEDDLMLLAIVSADGVYKYDKCYVSGDSLVSSWDYLMRADALIESPLQTETNIDPNSLVKLIMLRNGCKEQSSINAQNILDYSRNLIRPFLVRALGEQTTDLVLTGRLSLNKDDVKELTKHYNHLKTLKIINAWLWNRPITDTKTPSTPNAIANMFDTELFSINEFYRYWNRPNPVSYTSSDVLDYIRNKIEKKQSFKCMFYYNQHIPGLGAVIYRLREYTVTDGVPIKEITYEVRIQSTKMASEPTKITENTNREKILEALTKDNSYMGVIDPNTATNVIREKKKHVPNAIPFDVAEIIISAKKLIDDIMREFEITSGLNTSVIKRLKPPYERIINLSKVLILIAIWLGIPLLEIEKQGPINEKNVKERFVMVLEALRQY